MIEIIGRSTCTTCRKAFALLDEKKIDYSFRDYAKDPLSASELEGILGKLGMNAGDLLRKKDKAFKELGLTGKEDNKTLLRHMIDHPGLIQRPIAQTGSRAMVARPFDTVLELTGD